MLPAGLHHEGYTSAALPRLLSSGASPRRAGRLPARLAGAGDQPTTNDNNESLPGRNPGRPDSPSPATTRFSMQLAAPVRLRPPRAPRSNFGLNQSWKLASPACPHLLNARPVQRLRAGALCVSRKETLKKKGAMDSCPRPPGLAMASVGPRCPLVRFRQFGLAGPVPVLSPPPLFRLSTVGQRKR